MPADRQAPAAVEQAAQVFCELLQITERALQAHQRDEPLPIDELLEALAALADELEGPEGLLMALSRGGLEAQELSNHLVNTALLSLMLGRELGLEREQLLGLAAAALLHDLPKAGLDHQALNALERSDRMEDGQRAEEERRWLSALGRMTGRGGPGQHYLERLVTAYESQLEFSRDDLYAGEPGDAQPLALICRLVRICDRLDTLTWARPGKPAPTLHEALLRVIKETGEHFEPSLTRAMVQALGLFPSGTLVRLNTGQVAVVVRQDPDGHPERPTVRVVADASGWTLVGDLVQIGRQGKTVIVGPELARDLKINPVAAVGLGLEG
jgi:hypothetical protein